MTDKDYTAPGLPHASRAEIWDLRRTPEYVAQGLLRHVSHLCGPARFREPQEMMLRKECKAQGIERIPGEENRAFINPVFLAHRRETVVKLEQRRKNPPPTIRAELGKGVVLLADGDPHDPCPVAGCRGTLRFLHR